ncbi:MAG TPA: ATP-binding cassette domain-containing protein [Verrucomicrobiae bacterium]|nr:ATP-binding cassette domain-containing protein [Verrucomicrobiae bacterium]
MNGDQESATVLSARNVCKTFVRESGETVAALRDVSLKVDHGTLTALVGPDGAGKTTLMRLMAGLMSADSGELSVLSVDVAADPQQIQERIGYMPQRFGLYEDLSVQENLDLYADLHGVSRAERRERYPRLMEMTKLGAFPGRLAGRLSGGMKQKLGLACTLVRAPELLLLDEPTVGVDPLSRRELWEIIRQLVQDRGLTVLMSTSYLDEAERCGQVILLHEGNILMQGGPDDVSGLAQGRTYIAEPAAGEKARALQARLLAEPNIIDALPQGGRVRFVTKDKGDWMAAGDRAGAPLSGAAVVAARPRLEDGFMLLLRSPTDKEKGRQGDEENDRETGRKGYGETEGSERDKETRRQGEREQMASSVPVSLSPGLPVSLSPVPPQGEAIVEVRDLVRRFGVFTAVDHVSFSVRRGEIFGLLGPNGAGKTTTFRMLCGLLPATSGTLEVAGVDLRRARASARQRIGYVAQKFSLYAQLSVGENLEFFASAYNLRNSRKRQRIAWAMEQFGLSSFADLTSGFLPGGFRQRLAMAVALIHDPEILFLDEPTSGADPLARREFWRRIVALAESGVTVIVTTHFMEEAEYCDRIAIMDAGRVLAQGTPAEIRRLARSASGEPTMEDAFIAVVEQAREAAGLSAGGAAA